MCTMPCSLSASGPNPDVAADAGMASVSADAACLAAFSENGPPLSSYYPLTLGTQGLQCIAGYCTWR